MSQRIATGAPDPRLVGPRTVAWTTERARHAARVLLELGRLLAESPDPQLIARRIAERMPAIMRAARAATYRIGSDPDALGELAAGTPLAAAAARVAGRERYTVMSADLTEDPALMAAVAPDVSVGAEPARAVLAIPLLAQDRVLGALVIVDAPGRVFGPEELGIAHAFADRAALALETTRLRTEAADHARRWREAERRRREAEVEAELARDINASLEVHAVLQRVADAARELTGGDTAMVALRDPASDAMIVRYRAGSRLNAYADGVIEPGRGVAGRVLTTGRPVSSDLGGSRSVTTDQSEEGGVLAVPISLGERIIGLVSGRYRTPRAFGDRDEAVLVRLAAQAAVAIENARLFAGEQDGRLAAEASALELRESEERFRQLVDIFLVLDPAGRFLEVNEGACRSLGYTREELRALTIADIEEDFIPGRITELWSRLAPGVPVTLDTVHRRKDGSSFPVELRVGLFDSGGRRLLFALGRDVTERRGLEDQVRRAQKMEAIGRVAGGVAHDFNNLLTVITGRSHLLLRRVASDDAARRDVVLIHETANRAAALTRQLLAFARKQPAEPAVIDLNAVLSGMEVLLRRAVGEDVELTMALEPQLGRMRADAGQIEQVVMNLAVNARDAMPAGGRLVIETSDVDLPDTLGRRQAGVPTGPHVTLVVCDTGCGMDPETKSRIFEPFFTTKAPDRGTGLGLATVYGIVRESGGTIRVESEPGRGTTFSIYLPRVDDPLEGPTTTVSPPAGRPGSETILLVEDAAGVRDLARDILEAAGYVVIEAGEPETALRIGREHAGTIHLLITDLVMPKMRGQELVQRLVPGRPGMKVLFMSGHTPLFHGLPIRDVPFLQKPFTPDDLLRNVRELLDG